MGQTDDLHDTIRRFPINHQMARLTDTLVIRQKAPPEPKMIGPNSRYTRHVFRPTHKRHCRQTLEYGQHQPMIAGSRIQPPDLCTLQQDQIDLVFGAPQQAVSQVLSAIPGQRSRHTTHRAPVQCFGIFG